MLTKCSRCDAELPLGSKSCKRCGQTRSSIAYGFATSSAVSTSTRLIQIVILLIKVCLWGFAAFIEIGSLCRVCHGDLTMSVIFSVVMFGLICFNKRIQRNYKGTGIALTLLVFVGLVAFSQSSNGKASYAAQSRQDAQDKAKEQALEARRIAEDSKRQEQETKQEAQDEKAQTHQGLISKPSTKPNTQNGLSGSASTNGRQHQNSVQHKFSAQTVVLVANSLNRLQSLSRDPISDEQLVQMSDKCSAILAKQGISEPSANIIVAVNLCIPDGAKQPLPDVFALYTTLRKRGVSPSKAVIQVYDTETAIVSGGG